MTNVVTMIMNIITFTSIKMKVNGRDLPVRFGWIG